MFTLTELLAAVLIAFMIGHAAGWGRRKDLEKRRRSVRNDPET